MKLTLNKLRPTVTRAPYRMMIYGQPSIGKSTFASHAPNPIFADIERGANAIAAVKVPINTWPEFLPFCRELYQQEHEFKTLVLDSLDWLVKLMIDYVVSEFNKAKGCTATDLMDISRFGGPGQGYLLLDKEVQKMIRAMDALREHKKMNILLIAHEPSEGKTVNDLIHGQFTRYDIKTEKRVAAMIVEWCDFIFRAAQDLDVKVDGNKNRGAKGKAVYNGRILYTKNQGNLLAKRRIDLPDILNLDYAEFAEAEEAAYKRKVQEASEIFADTRLTPSTVRRDLNGSNVFITADQALTAEAITFN